MTVSSYKSKLWDLAKAVIIRIFMSLNALIRQYKRLAITNNQEKEQYEFK